MVCGPASSGVYCGMGQWDSGRVESERIAWVMMMRRQSGRVAVINETRSSGMFSGWDSGIVGEWER